MTLAERLKNERKKSGLSQKELADKLDMNARTYASYERGERDISTAVLLNICKVLEISSDVLLGNTAVTLSPAELHMNMKPIPLVGRVAAGLNCHAEDNIEGYILTDSEILHEGYEYFWLTVKGDSMEPELHDGDRVLVREQETLDSECFAVVRIDGEDGVVKKVRIDREKITLTSINPYYPPRVFEREQMNMIAIVGKVVQSQRIY
ncbi:MAG TPA: XRE family transcriptional regulator [Ruminococcus sp.]|nr:XRE family transcriptional regulator [Ruminococcus sp.]